MVVYHHTEDLFGHFLYIVRRLIMEKVYGTEIINCRR